MACARLALPLLRRHVQLRTFMSFAAPPTKKPGSDHIRVLKECQERAINSAGGKEAKQETATLAAGCYWSIQLSFDRIPGVLKSSVGYTGGHVASPSYEDVCSGKTGHTEAVEISFNPEIVGFEDILTVFWDIHDPTTLNRQGNDVGTQYRSGIYFHNNSQKQIAEGSLDRHQENLSAKIVTEILPCGVFYKEKDLRHQQYLQKGGQLATKGCTDPIRCYG